jgi:hypothetical protein
VVAIARALKVAAAATDVFTYLDTATFKMQPGKPERAIEETMEGNLCARMNCAMKILSAEADVVLLLL